MKDMPTKCIVECLRFGAFLINNEPHDEVASLLREAADRLEKYEKGHNQ